MPGNRSMRVTCIANQKGGVGKTTTAVNLARSLALCQEKVLLIDLDPQGNATLGLKAGSEPMGTGEIFPGLIFLSGYQRLAKEGLRSPSLPWIKSVLSEFAGIDRTLLDCPPRVDTWGLVGLQASQDVLIPVQSEFFAMQGLAQMLGTLERIRSTHNPDLEVAGYLLTMVDWREPLHLDVVQEVRGHFQNQVFRIEIPRDLRLAEAASHGKPVWDYDCTCPGALAYLQLAREVRQDEP